MNFIGKDPFLGCFGEDAAGVVLSDFTDFMMVTDDSVAVPAFAPSDGGVNYPSDPSEARLLDVLNSYSTTNVKKQVMGAELLQLSQNPLTPTPTTMVPIGLQATKAENIDLENEIKSFNCAYEEFGFHVEESEGQKSKVYEVENNSIIAKRSSAIKIKVAGAQSGQIVKVSMRYKAEENCQQPVLSCLIHKKTNLPNPESTFHVVNKHHPVHYVLEEGHHTALITVPVLLLGRPFFFHPIFRCWNSCDKLYGKHRDMILTLCDAITGEVLHQTSFDLRVCQNIGRDTKVYSNKGVKRLKKSTSKKPHQLSGNRGQASEQLQGGVVEQASAPVDQPSLRKTRHYLVEVDDELLPVLQALVKVRGKKLTEIDPACLPEGHGH